MKTRMLPTGLIWNREEGFTFLEVLVVLVIISLMMSITIPNFTRMFASIEGAREGDKVLKIFEKARAEAILQAAPVKITFYSNGLCTFQLSGRVIEYGDLRISVVLTTEEDQIVQTFKPDGTADLSILTFRTFEGREVVYTFNPVSGKIEMERRTGL